MDSRTSFKCGISVSYSKACVDKRSKVKIMGSVYYCRLFVSPYGDQGLCEFETELLPAGARLL